MMTNTNPKFELGRIVATPGALEALARAGQPAAEFIARHHRGDWGDLCSEDTAMNDEAVKDGGRILSAYILKTDETLWIITEAADDNGHRNSTCIMLPDDY